MNTLLLEHFAAVSKVAAYSQAREHQEGVDVSKGYLTTNAAGILFEGPRTFVCRFKYEASSRVQGIAGFTAPMMVLEIAPSTNLLRFYCGTTSATAPIVPGNNYQAVISYDGTTAVCYLNGSEAARFTVAGYAVTNVFHIGNPSYPPAGPVYSSSHFNYALSANEVSALYNNGDPAGYVLPSTIKQSGCLAEYLPQNLTLVDIDKPDKTIVPDLMNDGKGHPDPYIGLYFNTDQQDATYSRINGKIVANIGSIPSATNRPMMTYYRYKFTPGRYYRITIKWSLISGSYFLESFGNWATDAYTYTGDSPHTEHGSYEYVSPVLKAKEGLTNYVNPIFFFGTRVAQSEISIDEVKIEEYFSPSGTNGWLDSAKQLPLNDEYLQPLLETAEGYDLTANGTPEIVYKPE